jgi:hypothetical protein
VLKRAEGGCRELKGAEGANRVELKELKEQWLKAECS